MRKFSRFLTCLFAVSVAGHAVARGPVPIATPTAKGFTLTWPTSPVANVPLVQTASGVSVAGVALGPLGLGKTLSVAASGAITGAEFAGAWGAAIGGVGAVALYALPSIKDMMDKAGVRVSGAGSLQRISASGGYTCDALPPDTAYVVHKLTSGPIADGGSGAKKCTYDRFFTPSNGGGYIDSNSIHASPPPAGTPVPYDDVSLAAATPLMSVPSPTTAAVQALIDLNFPPAVVAVSASGPASTFMGNVVQLGIDGTQTTTATTINHDYTVFPGTGTIGNMRTTTTTVNTPQKTATSTAPDGAVTTIVTPAKTTTITTTDSENDPAAAQAQAKAQADADAKQACGLPGSPACKIDETGTPQVKTDVEYKPKLDKSKTDQDALRSTAGGMADKGFFANWQSFFVTPPLATCGVYELPRSMGSINPCPVVDGVRSFMAFLWAVTALWGGIKMVREVI